MRQLLRIVSASSLASSFIMSVTPLVVRTSKGSMNVAIIIFLPVFLILHKHIQELYSFLLNYLQQLEYIYHHSFTSLNKAAAIKPENIEKIITKTPYVAAFLLAKSNI